MTHEVAVNSTAAGWVAILLPIIKVVITAIVAWIGAPVGKYFLNKAKVEQLEAEKKYKELDNLAHSALSRLVADGIAFVEDKYVRPGKAQGKDPKKDKEFQEEILNAVVNFVRNMAANYKLDFIVKNMSDEQIKDFTRAIFMGLKGLAR